LSYGLDQVSLLQVGKAGSGITSRAGLAQFEATRLIRDLARTQHSTELAQLASRMGSAISVSSKLGEAPFAKIKGLIVDMIEKLEKALSELASSQAEMDKIRAQEKETYASNKADTEQGLEGVKMALKILREYYAKEEKAHEAAQGAGEGILGLLEVVESDFTKGSAEFTSTEESAQAAYDAQSKENEIEKVTKEQDVKYKTKESTELDKTVAETSSDRSGVQEELDAVLEYLRKLEEQCIAKAETFEERRARFEAELAGLKEALRVLEDETALLQRGSKTQLRGVRQHAAIA